MLVSNQFSSVGGTWGFSSDILELQLLTELEMHWPLYLLATLRSSVVTIEGYSKCYLKISHNQNIKLPFHNRYLRGALLRKENIAQNSVNFLHKLNLVS